MKKSVIYLLSLLTFGTSVFANQPIEITKIESINKGGANFNLDISFTANENIKSPWCIGFYMPRSYNRMNNKFTKVNADLKMSITGRDGKPQQLKYASNTSGLSLSAGYTTTLYPAKQFNLIKNHQYKVLLEQNNQWAPGNYSSMPQSFYFITDFDIKKSPDKLNFFEISTTPSNYNIGGYNTTSITDSINKNIKANLNNSKRDNNIADKFNLIPSPVKIEELNENFIFKGNLKIYISDNSFKDYANFLKKNLITDLKLNNIEIVNGTASKEKRDTGSRICFQKVETSQDINNNPEGYILEINKSNITITALKRAGFFYALQTLRILCHNTSSIPGLKIIDYPRFKYRGILLDTARHFFKLEEIKKLIDAMSALKLNTLHIHFSDDEGWRLDLGKKLQRLTKGSRRGFHNNSILTPEMFIQANLDISNYKNGQLIINDYSHANDLYKGIYSKEDIKEVIDYANFRNITVIPEIDLPGHARALVFSMPEIMINNDDKSQYISVQGYSDDVLPIPQYNKSKKFTETINTIITDIAELFNNQITEYAQNNEISVGGDEVSAGAWTNDKSSTGKWKELSALEKSQYFFKLLQHATHVKMSGWQQFVQMDDGKINNQITVKPEKTGHVWVWATTGNKTSGGIEQAKVLANNDYSVVLAFADNNYFDLTYTPDKWEPGFYWAGSFIDTNSALKSAYSSLQVINALKSDKQNNIKGLEGTLWSENIPSYNHLMYMGFPKMTGLAEASWSPSNITTDSTGKINWRSLAARLGNDNKKFLGYLNKKFGIIYRGYPNGISLEVNSYKPLTPTQ